VDTECNLESILDWYSEYLRTKHPKNSKQFERARKSDLEAALAEAITFHLLTYMRVHPEINEQVGSGGVDFICCASRAPLFKCLPQNQFVVEATSLDRDAVSKRSRIPKVIPAGISGGAIGLLTQNICNKAKQKNKQLKGYPMPRVLAIVSSHPGGPVLFNSATAKWALVSEEHFVHPIGSAVADPDNYTDLKNSVFIKYGPDGESIVPCRKEISAILLIAVDGAASEVFGIVHPEPEYPLNLEFLPNLPFVRIAQWPVSEGRIVVDWVITHPHGLNVPHYQLSRHYRPNPAQGMRS
jgi:hypothetical protein